VPYFQLKDAFDVDMDLSQIGRIEKRDKPLIRVEILFDSQPKETQSSQHFMIFIHQNLF
jgi:hypothetical protein